MDDEIVGKITAVDMITSLIESMQNEITALEKEVEHLRCTKRMILSKKIEQKLNQSVV